MSKYQELPQETLDGMSNKELPQYYKMMGDKWLRDKYAMAALTGLLGNPNWNSNLRDAVDDSFVVANKCMEERDK